jgi:Gpi18-like mannosyltransferase
MLRTYVQTLKEPAAIAWISTLLALCLRMALLDFQSGDYTIFLSPWLGFIRQHGGFWALRHDFSNYAPAYLYFLTAVSYIHGPDLYLIKLLSVAFDFAAAFVAYKILRIYFPAGDRPIWGYCATLLQPTVWLNSSCWGQCDVIYTCFLLLCFYLVLRVKFNLAMFAFGLAIAFKPQPVFLAPFLLYFAVKRNLSFRAFLWIPAVFAASLLPAWIAGRSFLRLLFVYTDPRDPLQLTLNCPNLYEWIGAENTALYPAFLVFALAGIFLVFCWLLRTPDHLACDTWWLMQVACTFLILCPYLLPRMHERYFYAADWFVVLACIISFPKRLYLLAIPLASLLAYRPFLLQTGNGQGPILAILPLLVLVLSLREMTASRSQTPPEGPISGPEAREASRDKPLYLQEPHVNAVQNQAHRQRQ